MGVASGHMRTGPGEPALERKWRSGSGRGGRRVAGDGAELCCHINCRFRFKTRGKTVRGFKQGGAKTRRAVSLGPFEWISTAELQPSCP